MDQKVLLCIRFQFGRGGILAVPYRSDPASDEFDPYPTMHDCVSEEPVVDWRFGIHAYRRPGPIGWPSSEAEPPSLALLRARVNRSAESPSPPHLPHATNYWLTSPGYVGAYSRCLFHVWLVGGFLCLMGGTMLLTIAPVATVLLYLVWLAIGFAPVVLTIGADGLALSWMGIKQFISYRELETVYPTDGYGYSGFVLVARGRNVSLATRRHDVFGCIVDSRRDDIVRHIRDSLRSTCPSSPSKRLDRLRMAGRPIHWWMHGLSQVECSAQSSDHPYRSAQLTAEDLWAAVLDVAAEPDVRAGAATVLMPYLDQRGRQCIERIARATANPALRKVFLAVSRAPYRLPSALEELRESE